MPPEKLAHYKIIEKIGAGGMGEVYRARDGKLDRDVALKILPDGFADDEERLARFEREAKLLASLSHANVGSIFGFEQSDGYRFLVLEIVEGEDLSERLSRGKLPVEDAIAIAKQVADALEAAHDQGIVHRDLKPANIKISPDGTAKVLDFGLGKAMEGDGGSQDLSHSPTLMVSSPTMAGVILGTAAYMSPEQARGKAVDRRADIWAFGVVLFEMLTGRQLFEGETISDTLAAVLRQEIDFDKLPENTPIGIRRLLERCLDRDPKQRLRDIGEARIRIDRVQRGDANASVTIAEAAAAVTEPSQPAASKRGPMTVIPWILVLVAVAVSVFMMMRGGPPPQQIIRAYMPPPEGSNYYLATAHPGPISLSPDGTKFAFSAHHNGEIKLWVREIDALEPRPLPSTSGAGYPFWSADSRHLAFFAAGNLKRIDASGGPPLTLATSSNGKSGSWNKDDVIVFAPTSSSAIHRLDAGGGTPVEVTQINRDRKENSHRYPQFLPDGKHFIYFARSPDNAAIRVGSIDGNFDKEIMRTRAQARYANGHLLFLRERTLMAQPFDVGSLELTGDAQPIAAGVSLITSIPMAVFTVSDNGILMYQTGAAVEGNFMRWRDREGRELETTGDPVPMGDFQLSPDEKVACIEFADAALSTADLWLHDFDTEIRTRFTFDPNNEYDPVWSPDGSEIIFCSDRTGKFDLYRKAVTGGEEETLIYESAFEKHAYDWSDDGRYVLYQETDSSLISVWALDLEENKAFRLTEPGSNSSRRPSFSPNGKWIVYPAVEGSRRPVYVQSFPTPGRKWQVSSENGVHPRWPKSGNIFYQTMAGEIMEVIVKITPGSVQLGGEVSLFTTKSLSEYYVSEDGQRVLEVFDEAAENPTAAVFVSDWVSLLESKN